MSERYIPLHSQSFRRFRHAPLLRAYYGARADIRSNSRDEAAEAVPPFPRLDETLMEGSWADIPITEETNRMPRSRQPRTGQDHVSGVTVRGYDKYGKPYTRVVVETGEKVRRLANRRKARRFKQMQQR